MAKNESSMVIQAVQRGELECFIVGDAPLILNSMNAKAMRDLLFPKGKKTKADKAQNLKHDPLAEYRASVYQSRDTQGKTALVFPATGFKRALATAALEPPGAVKSQIGRLTYVVGESVELYGVPQLLMSVVRSADMNKTPDVRSRAIIAEWACRVRINYVRPTLNEQMVATLLANAGVVIGIGDFRQEKGAGNYGRFRLVSEDDADLQRITASGGRAPQLAALASPELYDIQTTELFTWFQQELKSRGRTEEAST